MDRAGQQLQNVRRTFLSTLRQNASYNLTAAETVNNRRRQQCRLYLQETSGPTHALYNQSPTTQDVSDLQGRTVFLHHRDTSRPHAQRTQPSTTQAVNYPHGLFDLQESPGYSIQCTELTTTQQERDMIDHHRSPQSLSSHTTENTEPLIRCGLTDNNKPFAQCTD